jgi:hypothetical protein
MTGGGGWGARVQMAPKVHSQSSGQPGTGLAPSRRTPCPKWGANFGPPASKSRRGRHHNGRDIWGRGVRKGLENEKARDGRLHAQLRLQPWCVSSVQVPFKKFRFRSVVSTITAFFVPPQLDCHLTLAHDPLPFSCNFSFPAEAPGSRWSSGCPRLCSP